MTDSFERDEILSILNDHIEKWGRLKGKEQDVTQENFISNVLWTLDMIAREFERT